jgi:plasmid stabilization system protein ParE
MKLRFTPRATQDLIDIADYIRERNPADRLEGATENLGKEGIELVARDCWRDRGVL